MSVDLPAPLSPSRQWTSPRRRRSVTPESAITLPKYLLTFSSDRMMSSCLRVSDMVVSRLRLRDATAYIVVEQHRDQQHHAEEHANPVRTDIRIGDADLHDAEDQRAEARAHHRSIAARQQRAADHRSDDRFE